MKEYIPRNIAFKELVEVNDWSIKVYIITKDGSFEHHQLYQSAIDHIPKWLAMENSFNANHERLGFLILHAASEGVFSIINWWVGNNMLNTHVFLANRDIPNVFNKISGDGLSCCVWELEVIHHESKSWRDNVLKHPSAPLYKSYVDDVYHGIF